MKSQPPKIQKNIPLAPMTTFGIGGAARFFCEAASEEEMMEAVTYARDNNLEIFVLGGGSNILVSDEGFDGLVIKLASGNPRAKLLENVVQELSSWRIECWAGDSLANIVKLATENSLTGMEWAAGIPGTVGGAVRGNAGAYGSSMGDCVESVRVLEISNSPNSSNSPNKIPNSKFQIPNKFKIQNSKAKASSELKITNYDLPQCEFFYRDSIFKQNPNSIILSVVIKLEKREKAEIENKIREIIKKRSEKVPQDRSAGSFFQNPTVKNPELIKKFEKDAGCSSRDGKIPAGWLIDEAGLRGKKIGGAAVSEKHCNFVVNLGGAKAQDVVMLASYIKTKVRDELGVELKEEVQYVGF